MSRFDGIGLLVGIQGPASRDYIVEQVVVPLVGTVGVQRIRAFPTVLVQVEVHKPFDLKNMEFELVFGKNVIRPGHTVTPSLWFFSLYTIMRLYFNKKNRNLIN